MTAGRVVPAGAVCSHGAPLSAYCMGCRDDEIRDQQEWLEGADLDSPDTCHHGVGFDEGCEACEDEDAAELAGQGDLFDGTRS